MCYDLSCLNTFSVHTIITWPPWNLDAGMPQGGWYSSFQNAFCRFSLAARAGHDHAKGRWMPGRKGYHL